MYILPLRVSSTWVREGRETCVWLQSCDLLMNVISAAGKFCVDVSAVVSSRLRLIVMSRMYDTFETMS
jgi:hypothetical protein